MSTASSVAQFMAVLSCGVNPNLMSRNGGVNPSVDFQSLMNGGQIDPSSLMQGQGKGGSANLMAFLKAVNLNNMPAAQEALARMQQYLTEGEALNGASIWQFLRQQASLGGENAIVLNLSEKGIPQDVIDELKAMFGANDLITILRDPKLNAQLDNALKDADIETIDTPQLASVIDTILNQNKGDIDNTITFKIDPDMSMEKALEVLLRDGYAEELAAMNVQFVTLVQNQNQPQSVTLTFVQQKLADSQGISNAAQQAANVAASTAPLPLTKTRNIMESGNTNPMINKDQSLPTPAGLERAMQSAAPHANANAVQSIAERLAGIIGSQSQGNGQSPAAELAALMTSVDGEMLVDASGDFVMPFEAGFKTASHAANAITAQNNAAQSHPTTQMLAMSLTKMASKAANGQDSQTYRLQLDPPEMGRIDIEMDVIEKTGHLKAVITAEKPEALGLLQRDMHVLLKAMQDAGFEGMSQNDLAFNLSQGNENMADNNGHGKGFGGQGGEHSDANADLETASVMIEGEMSLIIDPVTGQRHVNMMV